MGPSGAGSCESQLRVSHGVPQFAVHAAGASWPQRPENLIVRYEASRRIISQNRSVIYAGFTVYLSHFHAFYSFPIRFLVLFSQKHLRCLGSRLVVETAWERYARDESADGTVMLPCYVWSCWGAAAAGRETAERMCGRCCYRGMWSCWGLATVLMLFAAVGGRCCGDEAADDAVTLLFAAVGGIDVRERECGDESADDAVAMLFAAVGGGCWGARLRRRICGRCCYPAICSCWG